MSARPISPLAGGTVLRLTLWYTAAFVFSLTALFSLAYLFLDNTLTRSDRQVILDKAHEYALSGRLGMAGSFLNEIRLQKASEERAGFFIRVAGPDGRTLVLIVPPGLHSADLEPLLSGEDPGPGEDWTVLTGVDGRAAAEVVTVTLAGGMRLQVGRGVEDRRRLLSHFRTTLALMSLPAVLLALVGGWLLAARSLAPLRDLIRTVEGVEAGEMDARVPVGEDTGELEDLARLFNRMLERIAQLIDGMRQALDNVAHDLRTPVARLRFTVENALRSPGDPEALREALMDCAEESERLVSMLDTLMDVSEAETGLLRLRPETVDLAALAADMGELYSYVAEEKGVELALPPAGPLNLAVDRNRLRQVAANLVDNAIKYTPPGGRVELQVWPEEGGAVLVVRDTGPGIAPGEEERIFERLYRGDKSRGQRGMGLGLSLVKAVVEAHRGRVSVANRPGGGAEFRVWLPVEEGRGEGEAG